MTPEDIDEIKRRHPERVERSRRPGTVQPCIVELFREFWIDASNEDRRTMWDLMRRYAEERKWK